MFRRLLSKRLTEQCTRRTFCSTLPLLNKDYQMYRTATVRDPAPAFAGKAVINGAIKEISSEDYKGKYVVLLFYPMDFTFVCPTEITAFSDRHA